MSESKRLKFALLVGLLEVLMLPSIVLADGGVGPLVENVDLQGAKMVSEGAYFYVEITNNRENIANLLLESGTLICEEWDNLTHYYGTGGGAGSNMKAVEFSLQPNESIKLHYQAPFIEENYINLLFRLDDLDDGIPYGYKELETKIVDLSCDLTYQRSSEDYYKLWSYDNIKELNDELKESNSELKKELALAKHDPYVTISKTYVIVMAITISLLCCTLFFLGRATKSKSPQGYTPKLPENQKENVE